MRYEYKVVPAPRKGLKGKDVKGDARFANALESAMNEHAAFGWQYLRADTLPFEERHGLTGKTTSYQTLLVFCRPLGEESAAQDAERERLPHLRAGPQAQETDYAELAPRAPAPEPAPDPRREHKAAQALRAHRVEADEAARRPAPIAGQSPGAEPQRLELRHATHSLQGIGGRD